MLLKLIVRGLEIWVISIATAFVAGLITYKKTPKNYTKSINKFTVRAGIPNFWGGTFGILVGIAFMSMALIECIQEENVAGTVVMTIGVSAYGLPMFAMMISPLPRFWDVVINENNITIIKFFVLTKHFHITDITHCIAGKGDVKVFVRGRKKTAFIVDAACNGIENFIQRMEKEQIPLYEKYMNEMILIRKGEKKPFVYVEEALTEEQKKLIQEADPKVLVAVREENDQ